MDKSKRDRLISVVVIVALVGALNFVDFIYTATSANASTSGLDISATIEPSSTVTIGANTVALNIVPSAAGTFKSNYVTVSAYTNTTNTCNVTMTTSSSALTSGANSIPSLTSAVSESDFSVNSWGYRAGSSGNYNPVVASEAGNPIATLTSMTGSSAITTDVYFAAKLNQAIRPGTYTNTVTFASTCPPPPSTIMQEQTASNLAILMPNTGDTVTLTDKRDNKEYLVGKIADGEYWMLDNLALDPTAVSLATLQGNTNASDTELGYLKNGGGTTSDQYATAGVANWTSSYSYSAPLVNTSYTNTTVTSYGPGSGKIGVYYNYCAASAGSYCYGNGTSSGTSSGNATSDICPSGWRMPSGYNGESSALISAYNLTYDEDWGGYLDNGSASGLKYNLSTPLSGYFYNGSADDQGSGGYFWSSTWLSIGGMYYLGVNDEGVSDVHYLNRLLGSPVRCIASF